MEEAVGKYGRITWAYNSFIHMHNNMDMHNINRVEWKSMLILIENLGDCIHRMGTQPENWLYLLGIEVPFEVDVGLVTNMAYIPWPCPYHLPWQVQKKWLYQNFDSSNPIQGLNNTWSSLLHKHIVLIYMCVSCGECFMESGRFPINWRSMLHILLYVLIYLVIYIPV